MFRKITMFFVFLLGTCSSIFAQDDQVQVAQRYITDHAADWKLSTRDISDMYISDNYADDDAVPLRHIYFIQRHAGIQVKNGVLNLNIMPNGEVLYAGCRFMSDLDKKINTISAKLSAEQALDAACRHLNLNTETWVRKEAKPEHKLIYDKGLVSYEDIQVQLVYQRINSNEVRLAYDIAIDAIGGQDYWSVRIDATNGDMLEKGSWTKHCAFHNHKATEVAEFYLDCDKKMETVENLNGGVAETGTYAVFPFPTESPIHGPRKLLVKPVIDSTASPFGWHDTDGIFGNPNYTITRGNNVHAYEDTGSKNASQGNEPNGGAALKFDFPYSNTAEPDSILNAATVNLFYLNNFMHDLSYVYGMNEKAGAFQFNNYGRGPKTGEKDDVKAEAQDGSGTDNANFSTPSDGGSGRMQMYVWTGVTNNIVKVEAPYKIKGTYEGNNPSTWGQPVSTTAVTGELVLAKDNSNTLCCGTITTDVKGKIAVIDRGSCEFGKKALNAQAKGAIAVIIVNFDPSAPGMAAGASGAQVKIPVVSMSSTSGDILKKALKDTSVTVSLVLSGAQVKPSRVDGDFDNGIVAHEYGHGISNRLTGGPQLADCLNNEENMGEGWSDFMSLIATAKPGDKGTDARGIGNFADRGGINSPGIRSSPYSTDLTVNPNRFDQTTGAETHRLGEVWTSMCWDLYWKMTEKYGFDADVIHGKGGNNKAIKLVFDGMKIQACQPGFVDGRDAILAADKKNFDGENECLIWEVFSRRGLGAKASQGSPLNAADPKESFAVLPSCLKTLKIEKEVTDLVRAGKEVSVKLIVRNDKGGTAKNTTVTDIIPAGCTYVAGSANKGGTINGGVITFKLGDFATGSVDTLKYKFLTPAGIESKSKYFEGFNSEAAFDKWDAEVLNDAKTGTSWASQNVYTFEGTARAAGAVMEDAQEADVALSMAADKGIVVTGKQPILRFYHNDLIQQGFDGMIVYVSKDKGVTWTDAEKLIFKNAYNGRVSYNSLPVPNQYAFWGNSEGWIPTYIDLSQYAGEALMVRFRFVSDKTKSADKFEKGAFVDNVEIMDLVNYNTEATMTADGGEKVAATAEARGTKIEADRVTLSSNEVNETLKVDIFPNPTDNYVNINVSSSKSGVANVSLIDANGRQVVQQKVQVAGAQMITLDTSHLPAGFYTVKVSQDSALLVKKLIVY
jgi:extracellular elastinolytic metalloproteinase